MISLITFLIMLGLGLIVGIGILCTSFSIGCRKILWTYRNWNEEPAKRSIQYLFGLSLLEPSISLAYMIGVYRFITHSPFAQFILNYQIFLYIIICLPSLIMFIYPLFRVLFTPTYIYRNQLANLFWLHALRLTFGYMVLFLVNPIDSWFFLNYGIVGSIASLFTIYFIRAWEHQLATMKSRAISVKQRGVAVTTEYHHIHTITVNLSNDQ